MYSSFLILFIFAVKNSIFLKSSETAFYTFCTSVFTRGFSIPRLELPVLDQPYYFTGSTLISDENAIFPMGKNGNYSLRLLPASGHTYYLGNALEIIHIKPD
jgi:hypothetical protein